MAAKKPSPLQVWLDAKLAANEARPIMAAELAARKALTELSFTNPTEGVNKLLFPNGLLTFTNIYDRTIDEASLTALTARLEQAGICVDDVVTYVPKLNSKAYRALSAPHRKLFDRCLTIKPSTPSLMYVENCDGR